MSISTGLKDGKKIDHTTECSPKNVGKKNETSQKEQAILEGLAKVKLKLREGYFSKEDEAINSKVIKPMLAESYEDFSDEVKFPCYIQPKLDGMRCLKEGEVLRSRKNKVIDTLPHISKEEISIKYTIDGELYAHGESFQDNMKLLKKHRPESVKIKFHVYDIVSDLPYKKRYELLKKLVKPCSHNIQLVPTYLVKSEKEFKTYHDKFKSMGYEGAIIRHGEDGYKASGRSKSLLKFKEIIDRAYPVIDVTPANKNKLHGVPVVKVTDKLVPLTTPKINFYEINGKVEKITVDGVECGYPTTRCNVKLSHEEREELLSNKDDYIGKTAEIRFFEFHDTGVPRFPVFYGLRLDK